MANQETNQATTSESTLEATEVITAQEASEAAEVTKGFSVKAKTKEAPRSAKTDDATDKETSTTTSSGKIVTTEQIAPTPKKRTPAKSKFRKQNKKKAEEEQKAIEEKIAIEAIAIQIKHCKTQAKLCKDQEGQFFLEMGKWLGEAKDKVKKAKGLKWLEWLRDNFDMTARSAQMYMETYKTFANNPQALSDLGYTKASILAPLSPDKREEFLSKQQYEVKEGIFKSVKDMTTREFEKAVREYKGHKVRSMPQKVSVEGFNKKLSSLGTQLDELVKSLSKVEGDSDACRKLLGELLKNSVSKLSEQSSELPPSDDAASGNALNPNEEPEVA